MTGMTRELFGVFGGPDAFGGHADLPTGRAFGSDPVRVASAHGSPTVDPHGVLQFL